MKDRTVIIIAIIGLILALAILFFGQWNGGGGF